MGAPYLSQDEEAPGVMRYGSNPSGTTSIIPVKHAKT
jgi:hypothetical protein